MQACVCPVPVRHLVCLLAQQSRRPLRPFAPQQALVCQVPASGHFRRDASCRCGPVLGVGGGKTLDGAAGSDRARRNACERALHGLPSSNEHSLAAVRACSRASQLVCFCRLAKNTLGLDRASKTLVLACAWLWAVAVALAGHGCGRVPYDLLGMVVGGCRKTSPARNFIVVIYTQLHRCNLHQSNSYSTLSTDASTPVAVIYIRIQKL